MDSTSDHHDDERHCARAEDQLQQKPSKRFKKLLEVIDKGLLESKKSIDTQLAVSKCYGEDASIFAGEGGEENANKMLANLITGVIDDSNDKLRKEIRDILDLEDIPTKLAVLDTVIDEQYEEERRKRKAEEDDKRTCQEAIDSTKLPENVSVSDVLKYHAYKIKVDLQKELIKELKHVEDENKTLLEQAQKSKELVLQKITKLEEAENQLEQTANMCSFVPLV